MLRHMKTIRSQYIHIKSKAQSLVSHIPSKASEAHEGIATQTQAASIASIPTFLLLLALALSSALTSCEKVIDITVNDAEQHYVIEGDVYSDSALAVVRLTKTRKLNDDNSFEPGKAARVTIMEDGGIVDTLREIADGVYQSQRLRAAAGKRYTLDVQIDGHHFSSTSLMPKRVPFDSIEVDSAIFFGFKNYFMIPVLVDPAGVKNYYRFLVTYNDTLAKDIIVGDDAFADGLRNRRPIGIQHELKAGYRMQLEMQCIDSAVYKYFIALAQMQQGAGSQTPVNPPSNISGGALGYFSAHSSQTRSVVLP